MKNYTLVRESDFKDVGMVGKSDAKSDAIFADDAKSDAESASVKEQKPHKKSTEETGESLQCIKVGVEGLEQCRKTRGKYGISTKADAKSDARFARAATFEAVSSIARVRAKSVDA